MIHFNALRTLARSNYWQIVYSRTKEIGNINLFQNNYDYTPLQIAFLQWLEVYHSLEVDLASKKLYISREVIESDIRVDAYLYWRSLIENKSEKEISELENTGLHDGAVVFKKRKK